MNDLRFLKGEFITQDCADEVFAIWCGKEYDSEDKKSTDYSLFAYCDPTNMVEDKNSRGNIIYKPEPILSVGLDGEECEYVIGKEDLSCWRTCTQSEINNILKFLAQKGYKWVMEECKLHKLAPGEKLVFDGPNAQSQNQTALNKGGYSSLFSTKPKVTVLKKKWNRQHFPIVTMTLKRKSLVINACGEYNKIKYPPRTYSAYNSNSSSVGFNAKQYGGYKGANTVRHMFDFDENYMDEDYWDSMCD